MECSQEDLDAIFRNKLFRTIRLNIDVRAQVNREYLSEVKSAEGSSVREKTELFANHNWQCSFQKVFNIALLTAQNDRMEQPNMNKLRSNDESEIGDFFSNVVIQALKERISCSLLCQSTMLS